jgi:pre-mRNA-processing factor 39
MMVAHDLSLEDVRKLKQSSKPDNFSLVADKEVESQVDKNTVDSGKEHRDAEDLKAMENVYLHHEFSKTAREYTEMVHGPHGPDKSGMKQMKSHGKQMADRDLNLCEQYDEKAIFQQDQGEQTPIAEPGCCDSPCIAIARSEKIDSQEYVIEISPSSHPETVGAKSDSTSGASMPKDGSSSDPPRKSPELEKGQPVEVQVKLDMKDGSSVNHVNPESCNHGPDQTQCDKDLGHESQDHIQSKQPQLPVSAKSSSSELSKTEMNTLHCEAPLKHGVANSQAHQFNNLSLAGQNTQQQWLSYTMPQNVQTSSQTQDQLIAQPNQGNQQYLQMTQGYASQMWQYYQQRMYYLQAQHNQQMQSLQQQQLPTEHLQQNFLQQVQQLNHQMVLWQQQQQQQQLLQQALPVPQQPDNKQGQSSSGDTKHEQNKHHQQASQMDNQSQQLQQQQLLYFQQQQQQMYLMHQQQQAQQQQLLHQQLIQQQQYLLQRPQQQEDSVQQQQMVLLQQQQQQFIQQQMQQYAQQQQPQQGPKDQNYNLNTQVHSRLIHLTSLFFKGFCFSTPLCKKFMNITSTS